MRYLLVVVLIACLWPISRPAKATSMPTGMSADLALRVGILTGTHPDVGRYSCTATLVGQDIVITSASCLLPRGPQGALPERLVFAPGLSLTGPPPRGTMPRRFGVRPVVEIVIPDRARFPAGPGSILERQSTDLALAILGPQIENLGATPGYLGFIAHAPQAVPAEGMLLGYLTPGQDPRVPFVRTCPLRAAAPSDPVRAFELHRCDLDALPVGTPMLTRHSDGEWYVAGVVAASFGQNGQPGGQMTIRIAPIDPIVRDAISRMRAGQAPGAPTVWQRIRLARIAGTVPYSLASDNEITFENRCSADGMTAFVQLIPAGQSDWETLFVSGSGVSFRKQIHLDTTRNGIVYIYVHDRNGRTYSQRDRTLDIPSYWSSMTPGGRTVLPFQRIALKWSRQVVHLVVDTDCKLRVVETGDEG